jgi:hypothetical protein
MPTAFWVGMAAASGASHAQANAVGMAPAVSFQTIIFRYRAVWRRG